MADEKILSVGIDIGTSTTQVIFSRITLSDFSGYFSVPNVLISDREVIYESGAHLTPLKDNYLIDTQMVKKIVESEFKKAGLKPEDTKTGAVIITGESAKKENAENVSFALSEFAGDFVVSSAGADLESVIAGKGSGAAEISAKNESCILNVDIGGGTTNIALFDCGQVISEGCLDIGGRLIKTDSSGNISYIAPSIKKTADILGLEIKLGDEADTEKISLITNKMCLALSDYILGNENKLSDLLKTYQSKNFGSEKRIDALVFSGGVADFIYNPTNESFKFGDIGEILARSVMESKIYKNIKVIKAQRTLSATVVGAGTHTLSVSGSTINYSEDVFPLKNIPVLKLTQAEESCLYNEGEIKDKVSWFSNQTGSEKTAVAINGKRDPSFKEIDNCAKALGRTFNSVLATAEPIIIILKEDNAKALGQAIERLNLGRCVICIDGVEISENDYIDIGKPIMGGIALPVVVKTLIFG